MRIIKEERGEEKEWKKLLQSGITEKKNDSISSINFSRKSALQCWGVLDESTRSINIKDGCHQVHSPSVRRSFTAQLRYTSVWLAYSSLMSISKQNSSYCLMSFSIPFPLSPQKTAQQFGTKMKSNSIRKQTRKKVGRLWWKDIIT